MFWYQTNFDCKDRTIRQIWQTGWYKRYWEQKNLCAASLPYCLFQNDMPLFIIVLLNSTTSGKDKNIHMNSQTDKTGTWRVMEGLSINVAFPLSDMLSENLAYSRSNHAFWAIFGRFFAFFLKNIDFQRKIVDFSLVVIVFSEKSLYFRFAQGRRIDQEQGVLWLVFHYVCAWMDDWRAEFTMLEKRNNATMLFRILF